MTQNLNPDLPSRPSAPVKSLSPTGQRLRRVAFDLVTRVEREGSSVQDLFEHYAAKLGDERDRRLLHHLATGYFRRYLTLKAVIRQVSARPLKKIDPALLTTLELAAYQMIFMDKIPLAAAVDEAVALVRSPKLKAYANGLLRELSRAIDKRGLLPGEIGDAGPRQKIMLDDGRFTTFSRPVLPAPSHRLRFLSAASGLPEILIDRWSARYEKGELRRILRACNSPSPLFLRPNPLKTSLSALLAEFQAQGIEAEKFGIALRLSGPLDVAQLPGFAEGKFYIQDKTAQEIAALLPVQPGQTVLDLCAAPGGKATAVAERLGDQGLVAAVDNSAARLLRVEENAARLGLSSIKPVLWPSPDFDALPLAFDAVLVDVPCSNTGVLRRRPEARLHFDAETLPKLNTLQFELAERGLGRLKPGGVLLYSTCSLEPEENRGMVDKILAAHTDLTLVIDREFSPQPEGGDGGYGALLRKAGGG